MSTTQKASTQDSFNMGVVAALHALKTALQASPGFNNDALVQVVRGIVNNPAAGIDAESFNVPVLALLHDHILDEHGVLALLHDHILDEHGNVRTKEVSL